MTSAPLRFSFSMPFASNWKTITKSETSDSSPVHLRLCLALVYAFTFSDFALKSLPVGFATVLRYLPEGVLYALAVVVYFKRRNKEPFPLARPLVMFAIALTVTTVTTASPALAAVSDVRSYFRFALFAYIVWASRVRREHIRRMMDGFLGLAVLELLIAAIELAGGAPARLFFAPELHWARGDSMIFDAPVASFGWISGTFANYNHFGMFMVMACVVAVSSYLNTGAKKYLIVGIGCGFAVLASYSRHSLVCLLVALFSLMVCRRKALLGVGLIVGAASFFSLVAASGAVGAEHDINLGQRIGSAFTKGAISGDPSENVRLYLLVTLPSRFLSTAPLLGEGPASKTALSDISGIDAPESQGFRAAQGLPEWIMGYLGDVVWVMLLGLYGVLGIAAFAYVLGTIVARAVRLRNAAFGTDELQLAEICLSLVPVYVLTGFFSLTIVARDTIPIFWLMVGAMLSLSKGGDRLPRTTVRRTSRVKFSLGLVRFPVSVRLFRVLRWNV